MKMNLSSAVTKIDEQHQTLVAMLDGLNDAVKNKKTREEIYRLIDEVITFTRLHFSTEEQFMSDSAYSDVEFHKEKHRQLMEDAIHLKGKWPILVKKCSPTGSITGPLPGYLHIFNTPTNSSKNNLSKTA